MKIVKILIVLMMCYPTICFAEEYLDKKLHPNWNTLPTRRLVIWFYHRIAKRLEALETVAGITPEVINEKEPDMNKIKRPTAIIP